MPSLFFSKHHFISIRCSAFHACLNFTLIKIAQTFRQIIKRSSNWKSRGSMGRRKSKRKAPTKKKAIEPLDTVFTCPFCNHEKSCEVNMDTQRNVGTISCNVCSEDFQTVINCKTTYLSFAKFAWFFMYLKKKSK